jgi:hypothetical protein
MKTSYYQSVAEKAERKPLNFQIHPPSEKYLEKYEKKKKSIRNRKVEQFESEYLGFSCTQFWLCHFHIAVSNTLKHPLFIVYF